MGAVEAPVRHQARRLAGTQGGGEGAEPPQLGPSPGHAGVAALAVRPAAAAAAAVPSRAALIVLLVLGCQAQAGPDERRPRLQGGLPHGEAGPVHLRQELPAQVGPVLLVELLGELAEGLGVRQGRVGDGLGQQEELPRRLLLGRLQEQPQGGIGEGPPDPSRPPILLAYASEHPPPELHRGLPESGLGQAQAPPPLGHEPLPNHGAVPVLHSHVLDGGVADGRVVHHVERVALLEGGAVPPELHHGGDDGGGGRESKCGREGGKASAGGGFFVSLPNFLAEVTTLAKTAQDIYYIMSTNNARVPNLVLFDFQQRLKQYY